MPTLLIAATGLQAFAALEGRKDAKKSVELANQINNMNAIFEMQNAVFANNQRNRQDLENRFILSRQAIISKAQLEAAMPTHGITGKTPTRLIEHANMQHSYNAAALDHENKIAQLVLRQNISGMATRTFMENEARKSHIPTLMDVGLNLIMSNPYIQNRLGRIGNE